MLIRIKKYRLSHEGRIYRQGETVELADSVAKKLLTSDNFEAVNTEPSKTVKTTSKSKTVKSEPVEVEESIELPDVDPTKAVVK